MPRIGIADPSLGKIVATPVRVLLRLFFSLRLFHVSSTFVCYCSNNLLLSNITRPTCNEVRLRMWHLRQHDKNNKSNSATQAQTTGDCASEILHAGLEQVTLHTK